MIPIMQRELDEFKDTIWNTHRIRYQKETMLPDGIPDHIYSFPEKYGLEQCGYLLYKAKRTVDDSDNLTNFRFKK